MEADAFSTQFFRALEAVSKSYGMKYSRRAFSPFQKLGETFWHANFCCGSFLSDGQLKVTVQSQIKPCGFDVVQFSVIDPGTRHRITDTARISASFAAGSLRIDSKTYHFPCGGTADFADQAEGYVRAVLDDLLETRTEFLASAASNDGGLLPYLINHWRDHPLEAGMAHLCERDYSGAQRCFELAEQTQCVWRKSIGKPGRYLHLIFIDYCRAMQSNIEWTPALVVNGFPENAAAAP